MTAIKDVTGTAFIVAEFRARENTEPHPLYLDRIVPLFLDQRTREAADAISNEFPAAATNVRIRTRYLDDRLEQQIARGCGQIVILGAGLDTRAVRKQAPGVLYFEIDDANTLGFKKARLTENGIDPAAIFIPGDYVAEGVLALLEAHGFKRDAPAFFIWEGNTMYLTKADVMKVLTELARGVREFSISFDYMSEEVIADATGDQRASIFVERFAAMGAPWRFGLNDVHALAKEAGVGVVDAVTTAELHRTYWPGRPLDSIMYQHYSLCTLARATAV
ncbi:MAG: SAM-dependent methyltransferase [Methyloceanibacter sp.]|jgi:methyltransferase (TIGR00027 family)|nr:MAG: class I SAM-dependent methyltransferase [Hyphomicrobiales bacterium]